MTTPCQRCGRLCRSSTGTPNAKVLRRAATGLCADCATTQFLRNTTAGALIAANGVECLRAPHIQQQFAIILATGDSDATPTEIDWERVIALWHLPVPGEAL